MIASLFRRSTSSKPAKRPASPSLQFKPALSPLEERLTPLGLDMTNSGSTSGGSSGGYLYLGTLSTGLASTVAYSF